jgi:outer membrane lipoprotein SlyB
MQPIVRSLIAVIAALGLTGCASTTRQAARREKRRQARREHECREAVNAYHDLMQWAVR